jgi:hypothetical protein
MKNLHRPPGPGINFMKFAIGFVFGLAAAAVAFILYLIFGKSEPIGQPRAIFSEITFQDKTIKGEFTIMEMQEGQKAAVTVSPKTAGGNAAGIEPGSAVWTSTDDSVVSVTQDSENELKAEIRGVDGSNNESVTIEFRADGKRGEGVREIVGTVAVTCTQGDAVVVDIEVGTPVDIEPETPTPEPTPEGSAPLNPDEEPIPGTLSGSSSGAGNEPNQGVENNPSAGIGARGAAGTTSPDESNQPPAEGGEAMTFDEAAADTAERNDETAAGDRQQDTALTDGGDAQTIDANDVGEMPKSVLDRQPDTA